MRDILQVCESALCIIRIRKIDGHMLSTRLEVRSSPRGTNDLPVILGGQVRQQRSTRYASGTQNEGGLFVALSL